MGSCGGKHDVISHARDVNIDTRCRVQPSSSRKRSSQVSNKTFPKRNLTEKAGFKEAVVKPSVFIEDNIPKTKDLDSEMVEVKNEKNEIQHGTPDIDSEQDMLEEQLQSDLNNLTREFSEERLHQVLNSTIFDDADYLEVIHEEEELNIDSGANISFVESEVVDEIPSDAQGNLKATDVKETTKTNVVEERTRKMSRDMCASNKIPVKRQNSNESSKNGSGKKKKDKNKENKNEKLWTSRSVLQSKWKEEKTYTTKGKDGVVFKIRILRKPTKEEEALRKSTFCIIY